MSEDKDIMLKIIDELQDIYHTTQYGKLMPGIIHNINGRITAVDSKIQLVSLKLMMKLKKLTKGIDGVSEELSEKLVTEYKEILTQLKEINETKKELSSVLSVLNDKVSLESELKIEKIDLNDVISEFDKYFYFYKRYKHNTTSEMILSEVPVYVNMEYKDIYFLLYAVVKNGVDATYNTCKDDETKITYITEKNDNEVVLKIKNNGKKIENKDKLFSPLNTDKPKVREKTEDSFAPKGSGLDLYFLKLMLEKYDNIKIDVTTEDGGSEFVFRFLQ